ncbi:MAG: hypothetical protein ABIJ34_08355 [archaeon]
MSNLTERILLMYAEGTATLSLDKVQKSGERIQVGNQLLPLSLDFLEEGKQYTINLFYDINLQKYSGYTVYDHSNLASQLDVSGENSAQIEALFDQMYSTTMFNEILINNIPSGEVYHFIDVLNKGVEGSYSVHFDPEQRQLEIVRQITMRGLSLMPMSSAPSTLMETRWTIKYGADTSPTKIIYKDAHNEQIVFNFNRGHLTTTNVESWADQKPLLVDLLLDLKVPLGKALEGRYKIDLERFAEHIVGYE